MSTNKEESEQVRVVIDNGTYAMKVGFSNSDLPAAEFPTVVGYRKGKEKALVGHNAEKYKNELSMKYPIENGRIIDWDSMEQLWLNTFRVLNCDPKEYPVLLTEKSAPIPKEREKITEILFEKFNIPEFYLSRQPNLALYAAGKTTGLVLDCGGGRTDIVPIYEGFCLPETRTFGISGEDLTTHMMKLMKVEDRAVARKMKETSGYVALNLEKEMSKIKNLKDPNVVEGKDQEIREVDNNPFLCAEALFQPELIGIKEKGLHEQIVEVLSTIDPDVVLKDLVISGGGMLFKGFTERLANELSNTRFSKINIIAPKNRKTSVWQGGSLVASLTTFSNMWISRREYDASGPGIVGRKCF